MSSVSSPPHSNLDRALASRTLERIRDHEKFSSEQLASLSKWLSASLLAVNGGGAIAVFNHLHDFPFAKLAGFSFMIGIALALLSGAGLQEFYNRIRTPLVELDSYWTAVSLTGVRDESKETRLNERINRINRLAFIPPTIGWISGILFILGSILLAF